MDALRILLIDDNPGDARLIREMLAEVGGSSFRVECADRLGTALERLAVSPVDVVLLDLTLPDSAGIQTFLKVQAHAPEVPVVVLTGLDDDAVAMQALQAGAQDYLVKGQFHGRWLAQAARHAVRRHRLRRRATTSLRRAGRTEGGQLHVEDTADVTVVRLLAKRIVDQEKIDQLGGELFRLVIEGGRRRMLLNLASVEYLSNAALGMLVGLGKKLKGLGGGLRLCEVSADVYEQFVSRHLDSVFDLWDEQASALRSFPSADIPTTVASAEAVRRSSISKKADRPPGREGSQP